MERQIWRGEVLAAGVAVVVEDTSECLITFTPTGSPFWFPDEPNFPSPSGRHPWYGRAGWSGHGKLTITPATGDYAVSHFWAGDDRDFVCWYLNIQEPMRRTAVGYDSQDLELDIVVWPDRRWDLKDDDVLEQRVVEGRWTADEIAEIRKIGDRIIRDVLEPGEWWWDTKWASWDPPADMTVPAFPDGWPRAVAAES